MNKDELIQQEYIKKARAYVDEYKKLIGHEPSSCVVTFGCQMNARDSEKLCGILESAGFILTDDENADLVVYNTCTVRDNANQRVYGRLGALHSMKKKNPYKKIALCGCISQHAGATDPMIRNHKAESVTCP